MSLDDDIARIAALRGRKASDYADPERFVARPQLTPAHVANVFRMSPNGVDDIRAWDRLPSASREFIRESPRPINALVWAGLLANFAEPDLIATARSMIKWPSPPPSRPSRRSRRL